MPTFCFVRSSVIALGLLLIASTMLYADEPTELIITQDTSLDSNIKYSRIVIAASNITLDGRGALLVGMTDGKPSTFKDNAISAKGVHGVKLKNIRASGWETGLKVSDGSGWQIENCDFSGNFHDPDFGWGENGRRGGIVLERVTDSVLRGNRANQVWDACVLVDSNNNLIEDNDFSRTSNTCLKLWTSSGNTIRKNNLSYGIRIAPAEVHARDSTSVLIESGSCRNLLLDNDCTHGGDGIFVRVLNGWCSTDNRFEGNDCSYANNNGIECWAPRNLFIKNKANHCSYGFWLGGSDQTRLIENEASYNGLESGAHNSPHLPNAGHAGIVFMFGSSSHTLARGNKCIGNNGAGIALIGDLASQGKKWRAYHWVIEDNQLSENRWGIYAKHADWVSLSGNRFNKNSVKEVLIDGDVTRLTQSNDSLANEPLIPQIRIIGPISIPIGTRATWKAELLDASLHSAKLDFDWDFGDGERYTGSEVSRAVDGKGFHRVGVNASNGKRTEVAWLNYYAVAEVREIGTDGTTDQWFVEDFDERKRSQQQTSVALFSSETQDKLIGTSALQVVINPYRGFRAALTYPKTEQLRVSIQGKTKLSFWLKAINEDITGWQGGPFITLYGETGQAYHLEPRANRDLMRESPNSESREGWRLWEIPLVGDDVWQSSGELPKEMQRLSLAFDSWGAPTLRFWIDGLAIE